MAILKKPEPKKCKCIPSLMGSLHSVSKVRDEMDKVQLATMKANLRKSVAEADLAEIEVIMATKRLKNMA